MTGVRTEWHLGDLMNSDDPFAGVVYSSGVILDLRASEDELAQQLCDLLKREGRLAASGLTCQLKDDGQNCLTCPAATLSPDEGRSVLCRLGKDQFTVEGRYHEQHERRRDPLREMVELAEEVGEIVPDDLTELLTEAAL